MSVVYTYTSANEIVDWTTPSLQVGDIIVMVVGRDHVAVVVACEDLEWLGVDGVRERHPFDSDVGLLGLAVVHLGGGGESPGQEDVHGLVTAAG